MFFNNIFGLLYEPEKQWRSISDKNPSIMNTYLGFLIFMAVLPPASAFIGSTYVGWSTTGMSEVTKLTTESALALSIIAYVAILTAVLVLSAFIQWMAKTYGADPSLKRCVNLAAYSCTPLFLVSVFGAYPILWLNMLLSLGAIAWAVYLLYTGVPIVMGIEKERGFLFANSILTVCMVILVGMLAITVIFWGSGFSPIFKS